ncbi:MAG: efflux RND transporter periplasmic adaptor subunit [Gammaproteobacteria bacterium]
MRWVVLFLVIAGVGGGLWWLSRPKPVEVLLHTVERGHVRATVSNTRVGTVEACSRAKMSPSMPGIVAVLPVREGDQVAPGQVLMEIWNDDLKAELVQVEADIRASERRADEACVTAAGALREAKRLQGLAKQRLVSEEALDNAQTRADSTRAMCAAARATIATVTARHGVVDQQIERSRLRAPFGGVVAEINAKLGEFITPSPTGIPTLPAIDLIDMSCLYVSAPIDEIDAPAIRPGMSACVSLDAFADKRCGAVVRRVAPYVLEREKQARTVEVEVELKGPEDLADLLPGYSADIEILVDEHPDVLRIPSEAILNGTEVLIYHADTQRLEKRAIKSGVSNWEFTEVLEGLEAGQQIVTSIGRKGVTDGAFAVPDDGIDDTD